MAKQLDSAQMSRNTQHQRPGTPISDVDTPALLVDLDAMERNLQRMASFARQTCIALRPHIKTHKSIDLALRQLGLGAIGVCCQKVSEAEIMVAGGIHDVLITNQIVSLRKIERLLKLARVARIGVCVDDVDNVAALDAATRANGIDLDVYVEIDVGAHRCGVAPGTPALELTQRILTAPRLRFMGLQAYNGPAQHIHDATVRQATAAHVISHTRETRDLLLRHGISCPVITGAGTGTYSIDAVSGVFNELQPGSYLFMDGSYSKNREPSGTATGNFELSLFVLTTIMSRTTATTAIVDAGLKAIGVDAGMPELSGIEGVAYTRASDEHGTLRIDPGTPDLRPGDMLRLVPGNCDPTVNLHDRYVGYRGQYVESSWSVSARGPGN